MPNPTRILVFAGSTRAGSFNKKLARIAAAAARDAGGEVREVDLRDFPLPLFDGDVETASGLPDNARKLQDLFLEHDALLIASPEYNSSLTAVLKNTIDWVSRPAPGRPQLAAFANKVAGLMSAAPGALGGLRGLVHLRAILSNINVLVIPDQLAIPRAAEAFDESGALKDAALRDKVAKIAARTISVAARLRA